MAVMIVARANQRERAVGFAAGGHRFLRRTHCGSDACSIGRSCRCHASMRCFAAITMRPQAMQAPGPLQPSSATKRHRPCRGWLPAPAAVTCRGQSSNLVGRRDRLKAVRIALIAQSRIGAGDGKVSSMLKHFDHVTVAVADVPEAIRFFGLLGFELDKDVVISGPTMDRYMGIDNLEARHVTLFLTGAEPRLEVQLLHFNRPAVTPAPDVARLDRIGFNHICFAVEDIDEVISRVTAAGVRTRNEMMTFHDRKLVFLEGPEGITVELAQWL